MSHRKRVSLVPAFLALLLVVPAGGSSARDLLSPPSLGLPQPVVPRAKPGPAAPTYNANQCQLLAGTCPLGRLQRSGSRCYCASPGGGVRQGGAKKRGYVPAPIQPAPAPKR